MPQGIMPDSARQVGSATTYGLINRGPRLCLHGGTTRQCWTRRAGRRARSGSSLQTSAVCGLHGGWSSRSAQTTIQDVRILSHLHSLMVTMSQKSSLPQPANSVLQALMSYTTTVLSEGPKNATIHVSSETIWGIPVNMSTKGGSTCPRIK